MASPPAKKRRKTRPSSALSSQDSLNSANDRVSELIKLKVFEDAEESDIKTEEDGAIGGELGDVDKELWFFQLPKDFDLKLLDQQEMSLKIGAQLEKRDKTYSVRPYPGEQSLYSQNYAVFSPSAKPGRLKVCPPLEGYVNIQRTVNTPPVVIPAPSAEPKVMVPQALKKRWKPFGYKKPRALTTSNHASRVMR